jgi:hypothetical protein
MKILIACEESQTVTKEFRKLGLEAFSNDIIECSGGYPEWHLKMDVFEAVNFYDWNAMIAFPPCTYLTTTANRSFIGNPERWEKRLAAVQFVWKLMNVNIPHIAIENPKGVLSTHIRKLDQYIHPYEFGHNDSKMTGLWIKNLPLLERTKIVEPEWIISPSGKRYSKTHWQNPSTNNPENAKLRSRTYKGIAQAMAEQWGNYLTTE